MPLIVQKPSKESINGYRSPNFQFQRNSNFPVNHFSGLNRTIFSQLPTVCNRAIKQHISHRSPQDFRTQYTDNDNLTSYGNIDDSDTKAGIFSRLLLAGEEKKNECSVRELLLLKIPGNLSISNLGDLLDAQQRFHELFPPKSQTYSRVPEPELWNPYENPFLYTLPDGKDLTESKIKKLLQQFCKELGINNSVSIPKDTGIMRVILSHNSLAASLLRFSETGYVNHLHYLGQFGVPTNASGQTFPGKELQLLMCQNTKLVGDIGPTRRFSSSRILASNARRDDRPPILDHSLYRNLGEEMIIGEVATRQFGNNICQGLDSFLAHSLTGLNRGLQAEWDDSEEQVKPKTTILQKPKTEDQILAPLLDCSSEDAVRYLHLLMSTGDRQDRIQDPSFSQGRKAIDNYLGLNNKDLKGLIPPVVLGACLVVDENTNELQGFREGEDRVKKSLEGEADVDSRAEKYLRRLRAAESIFNWIRNEKKITDSIIIPVNLIEIPDTVKKNIPKKEIIVSGKPKINLAASQLSQEDLAVIRARIHEFCKEYGFDIHDIAFTLIHGLFRTTRALVEMGNASQTAIKESQLNSSQLAFAKYLIGKADKKNLSKLYGLPEFLIGKVEDSEGINSEILKREIKCIPFQSIVVNSKGVPLYISRANIENTTHRNSPSLDIAQVILEEYLSAKAKSELIWFDPVESFFHYSRDLDYVLRLIYGFLDSEQLSPENVSICIETAHNIANRFNIDLGGVIRRSNALEHITDDLVRERLQKYVFGQFSKQGISYEELRTDFNSSSYKELVEALKTVLLHLTIEMKAKRAEFQLNDNQKLILKGEEMILREMYPEFFKAND